MTATRERAINLRDWEVRAHQEGRLKLLVRPVKPQPYRDTEMRHTMFVGGTVWVRNGKLKADWAHAVKNPESMIQFCPYGQPGDRLRGREAFDVSPEPTGWEGHHWLTYVADGDRIEVDCAEFYMGRLKPGKRYPSIHMPRWAVRNWLEITEVRCGRVREMSEEEAIAAGFASTVMMTEDHDDYYGSYAGEHLARQYDTDHGEGAWERDWVWMIGIKRIEVAS